MSAATQRSKRGGGSAARGAGKAEETEHAEQAVDAGTAEVAGKAGAAGAANTAEKAPSPDRADGGQRRAPTRGRSRRAPDRLCAEAVELAREAVDSLAGPELVGEYLGAVADADRVVTHLFECLEPGYSGWRWAATVARASRARVVTLDETVLLPGPSAVLPPAWLPWNERLRPGDLGPGDLLPTEPEDARLEPGVTIAEDPAPNSALREGAEARPERATGTAAPERARTDAERERAEADRAEAESESAPSDTAAVEAPTSPPSRGSIAGVAQELGMDRPRVLTRHGLRTAADRWEEEYGPRTAMAQSAPASCVSCAFLVPLAGSLRQAFGVCANEYSPADGHVVSLAYGCGGHSEAAVMPRAPQPPPPVLDETEPEVMRLRGDGDGRGDGAGGAGGAGAGDGRQAGAAAEEPGGEAVDGAADEGAQAGRPEGSGANTTGTSGTSGTTGTAGTKARGRRSGRGAGQGGRGGQNGRGEHGGREDGEEGAGARANGASGRSGGKGGAKSGRRRGSRGGAEPSGQEDGGGKPES